MTPRFAPRHKPGWCLSTYCVSGVFYVDKPQAVVFSAPRNMGRKRIPKLADKLQAQKLIEEELRPCLPVTIPANATWLQAVNTMMTERPESYAGIVRRLADGDTVPSVVKKTGLPVELVRKIRDLHPEHIEAGRRNAFARLEEALHSGAARLADQIDNVPLQSLPITLGVVFDKIQLIRGEATSRVEHKKIASPEDLQAMFNALPEAKVALVEDKKDV